MSLSDRIRPGVECAPWVYDEVCCLEAERDRLLYSERLHNEALGTAVQEAELLRAELAACRDALAKIGPYYMPSTELSDDEVNAMYAMIDAARKGEETQ